MKKEICEVICYEDSTHKHLWKKNDGTPLCGAWIGLGGVWDPKTEKEKKLPMCKSCEHLKNKINVLK